MLVNYLPKVYVTIQLMVYRDDEGRLEMPVWIKSAEIAQSNWFTISRPTRQHLIFKRQSGGDMFALVTLIIAPQTETPLIYFENLVDRETLPPEFVPAIVQGVWEAARLRETEQPLRPVVGLRVTLIDARYHQVDSRPLAYTIATVRALRQAFAAVPLVPWKGPQALSTDPSDNLANPQQVSQFQMQFDRLITTIRRDGLHAQLAAHQFEQVADGIWLRPKSDVHHIVVCQPRWSAQININLYVQIPALTQLLLNLQSPPIELFDRYRGHVRRWSLASLLPDSTPVWSIDIGTDSAETAAAVDAALTGLGLPLLNAPEWASASAILIQVEEGRLRMGIDSRAALCYLLERTDEAKAILHEALARADSQQHWAQQRYLQLLDRFDNKLT